MHSLYGNQNITNKIKITFLFFLIKIILDGIHKSWSHYVYGEKITHHWLTKYFTYKFLSLEIQSSRLSDLVKPITNFFNRLSTNIANERIKTSRLKFNFFLIRVKNKTLRY